jgi:hypothetical protein
MQIPLSNANLLSISPSPFVPFSSVYAKGKTFLKGTIILFHSRVLLYEIVIQVVKLLFYFFWKIYWGESNPPKKSFISLFLRFFDISSDFNHIFYYTFHWNTFLIDLCMSIWNVRHVIDRTCPYRCTRRLLVYATTGRNAQLLFSAGNQ